MHKITKIFHTRSMFIATFVGNIERFAKLVRNVVCMRSLLHPGMLVRTVKWSFTVRSNFAP